MARVWPKAYAGRACKSTVVCRDDTSVSQHRHLKLLNNVQVDRGCQIPKQTCLDPVDRSSDSQAGTVWR